MTLPAARVLADPVGVIVDLVAGAEPALDRTAIPADLQGIYQALAAVKRPATVASWLDSSTAPAALHDLKAGRRSLTHQALDELPPGKTVEHLRSVLVAIGTLPPRDEQLTRLERWIAQAIAGRP